MGKKYLRRRQYTFVTRENELRRQLRCADPLLWRCCNSYLVRSFLNLGSVYDFTLRSAG